VTYEDDEYLRRGLHRQEPPPKAPNGHDEAWSTPPEQPWPAPLAEAAYHGIAGRIVRTIEPESEADLAGLLFQLLAGIGNVLNAGSYVRVEDDLHPPRLFLAQVGRTSKGRKGTSWGRVRSVLLGTAPDTSRTNW
jgi:hypothetical protein